MAPAEGLGHRPWHLGLGLDDARPHLLRERDGHGPPLFGLGLRDLLVGVRLVDLELGADVLADVDIRDVDGQGAVPASSPLGQHVLGDVIRVLQDVLVGVRRGIVLMTVLGPCRALEGPGA